MGRQHAGPQMVASWRTAGAAQHLDGVIGQRAVDELGADVHAHQYVHLVQDRPGVADVLATDGVNILHAGDAEQTRQIDERRCAYSPL
jgi:hypothetical protein